MKSTFTLTAFSISVGKSQCWLKPSIPVYEFTQIPSQESFFSFWPKKREKTRVPEGCSLQNNLMINKLQFLYFVGLAVSNKYPSAS